jgi:hypothetical protein
MRAVCSITRAPILIRRSRMVANSALATGLVCGMAARGLASHPFTWEESVGKFDGLVAGRIDAGLGREIKDAVLSLESIQVRDLVKLLSYAKAPSSGASGAGRKIAREETA